MNIIETIPFSDRQFSITEAAAYLRISRTHLYKLMRSGTINPVKLGDRPIISGAELQRALASLAELPEPSPPAAAKHKARPVR